MDRNEFTRVGTTRRSGAMSTDCTVSIERNETEALTALRTEFRSAVLIDSAIIVAIRLRGAHNVE